MHAASLLAPPAYRERFDCDRIQPPMVRFAFSVEDLARTRFAISPMFELERSLLALRDPSTAALHVPFLRSLSGRLAGIERARGRAHAAERVLAGLHHPAARRAARAHRGRPRRAAPHARAPDPARHGAVPLAAPEVAGRGTVARAPAARGHPPREGPAGLLGARARAGVAADPRVSRRGHRPPRPASDRGR